MKKIAFSLVALVAFAGVAHATPKNNPAALVNTGSATVNVDITRTQSTTTTNTTRITRDNYAGVGTKTDAEHNGVVEIKTNGNVRGVGATVNLGTANANARELSADGSISVLNTPVASGNVRGSIHSAESNSVSGSVAGLAASGAASGRVTAGGYSATSTFSGRQWGDSVQNTAQTDVTNVNRIQGTGSLNIAR